MKLQVPAPGEKHDDPMAMHDVLSVSFGICILLAIAMGLFFSGILKDDGDGQSALRANSAAKTRSSSEPAGGQTHKQPSKKRAAFSKLGAEQLRAYAWDDDAASMAWEVGPREAAEAACEHYSAQLVENTLEATLMAALLTPVRETQRHAPWSCLSRLYLDDQLDATGELHQEMAALWRTLEAFEDLAPIASSIVADFRTTRDRPKSPRFYRWLSVCALNLPFGQAAQECHRLLRQLAPEYGEDFLMMADRLLGQPLAIEEIAIMTTTLGMFARRGQPFAWRVAETTALPDYDVDFRQGTVFTLCRLAHSPNQDVAGHAASALAHAAGVSNRPGDTHILYRWRHTCRLAFAASDSPSDAASDVASDAPVAVLHVWSGQEHDLPDYTLAGAIERGDCKRDDTRPAWYCGAERWRAGRTPLSQALAEWYNESRYVEWSDR
ncbi:MAG: hypothetical protein H0U74_15090 [Bradymonadaceae bacterium]|nr:hypothetical protein [Lujinxingiaceae bacterium]